jgi:hypothetical protein
VCLPQLALAQLSPWVGEHDVRDRLAAREVIVRADADESKPRGRVVAAIRINAAPELIWRVLTDCQGAPAFVPGLKGCHVLQRAPDGAPDLIEHEVKYSWLMPTIRSVLHADYHPPGRIDLHRIRGDLKDEEATWLLERVEGSQATLVEYRLYIDPGFWIPQSLVRRSLRIELPAALRALRTHAEQLAVTAQVQR